MNYAFRIGHAILLISAICRASVLRVPSEFTTIQSALNVVDNGDTILIGVDVYAESLYGWPGRSFAMIGDVADSIIGIFPIIDPTSLAGSDSLACLWLDGSEEVIIEMVEFRNGPSMYPRYHSRHGGIRNTSHQLTLRSCRFDSCYHGLSENTGILGVYSCEFIDNRGTGVSFAPLPEAHRRSNFVGCTFIADGPRLGNFTDSTRLFNCTFSGEEVWIHGRGVEVRDCLFEGTEDSLWAPLWGIEIHGGVFSGNEFRDLHVRGAALKLSVNLAESTLVLENWFLHCEGVSFLQAGGGLEFGGWGSPFVRVSNNVFEECSAIDSSGFRSIAFADSILISENVFIGRDEQFPSVQCMSQVGGAFHDNYFMSTGRAIMKFDPDGPALDARFNWWGDTTGPFHPTLNPGGVGDRVSDYIDFDPWLTDTILAASDVPQILPSTFSFSAFPNPFNSEVTLEYELGKRDHISLALFDITGRQVSTLKDGELSAGHYRQTWNAHGYPSGVYFIRLSNLSGNSLLRKILLLK